MHARKYSYMFLDATNHKERGMSHFIILFTIDYDDTYNERYDALMEQIRKEATGQVWCETTSSCVIQANHTAITLDAILSTFGGLTSKDELVVIDLDNRQKSTSGLKEEGLLARNLGF